MKHLSATVWSSSSDDVVFARTSDGTDVTWTIGDEVADGGYTYEVLASDVAPGSRSRDVFTAVEPTIARGGGSFVVRNGSVLLLDLEEGDVEGEEASGARASHEFARLTEQAVYFIAPAVLANTHVETLDFVRQDDLVVVGAQCIGFDCIEGDTYGLDTLRLKENNVRIHFEDTSTSTSYPSRDWRITINDATPGGGNFFAIDNADAGVNRRVITVFDGEYAGDARLGVGTAHPTKDIEVENGNSPTLRLKQSSVRGLSEYTWDVSGNEANFFVRDVTHGSTLPFRIEAGTPHNAIYVSSTGNVGLSTETPTEKLHVAGNALIQGKVELSGKLGLGTSEPTEKLHVVGNALIQGKLEVAGSVSTKSDIETLNLDDALNALDALEPVQYRHNNSTEQLTPGFIAEDVPDLVATVSRQGVDPLGIVAVLTKVAQQQQQLIETLTERVDTLTERVDALTEQQQ